MRQRFCTTDRQRIVYSLNVEDLQTVANDRLSRDLTAAEIASVEERLGDYIPWHEAISLAIADALYQPAKGR